MCIRLVVRELHSFHADFPEIRRELPGQKQHPVSLFCLFRLATQGEQIKRASMTFSKINSGTDISGDCYKVGKYFLYPQRTRSDAREHFGLSHREIELLVWISSGLTKNVIAKRMGISPSTADTFRRRAYAKLGVGTSGAAIAILFSYLSGTRVEACDLESLA